MPLNFKNLNYIIRKSYLPYSMEKSYKHTALWNLRPFTWQAECYVAARSAFRLHSCSFILETAADRPVKARVAHNKRNELDVLRKKPEFK